MTLAQAVEEAEAHNFFEAVIHFEQAYNTNLHNFTNEHKYLYAKSLNKCFNTNKNENHLNLASKLSKEVYMNEPGHRFNASLYMWLTYKCYVSAKATNINRDLRLRAANFIIQHTAQENYSPYELTVTEIVKFLDNGTPKNPALILEWQHHLNPKLLTKIGNTFKKDDGETISSASPFEKWHVTTIKLLLELEQYEACIQAVDTLMDELKPPFSQFHHNNDSWSLRRKAQALVAIQRTDEAYAVLQEVIKKFQHSAVYYDLMKISRLQGDEQQALLYGAEGLLDRSGKYEHKLKILKDCAEILTAQNLVNESYAHYALIQKVRERNEWKPDATALTEMTRLQEVDPTCKPFSNKQLQNLWQQWITEQYEVGEGTVKTILPNGKSGFIQVEEGQVDYYFNIRNSNCSMNELQQGTAVKFRKKPSFDRAKNRESIEAIQITVLEQGEA